MSRLALALVAAAGLALDGAPASIRPAPILIWNASASLPIGLYRLRPAEPLRIGETVAVRAPASLARFMAARRYLPAGLPLLKHIAALPGQSVCRFGRLVLIDGEPKAVALERDARGRPLPAWRGCRRLTPGSLFLLNPAAPASFDSRYFGPVGQGGLLGEAALAWRAPVR
jgi:conjugative transfer signal peptidase TraF